MEPTDQPAKAGHNNEIGERLDSLIQRIERLEEEKKGLADDIRDIYTEAKANGFDVKVMRQIVKIRRQDINQIREFNQLLELYAHAIGMVDPLGT